MSVPIFNSMKNRPLGVALAVIYAVGIWLIVTRATVLNDDPYITFRYSWNFAHGNGLVYNVGERVAGSTAPLNALIVGIMLKCGVPLGVAVGLLAAVAYALIGVFSWRLFSKAGLPWGGFVLAVLLLLDPRLLSTYGLETSMALGLALAAFGLYADGRINAAFIAAALLIGFRPDGGLVGVTLTIVCFIQNKRRLWPALGWGALVFLPLYAWFVAYYHALVPHTLLVKAQQGASPQTTRFWEGSLEYAKTLFVYQILPTGALVLAGFVLMIRRRWWPLPLFVLLYIVAFCGVINPPWAYQWYQYPYWLMRDAAVAWAIGSIAILPLWQSRPGLKWAGHVAAAVLLVGVAFASLWPERGWNDYESRYFCYRQAIDGVLGQQVDSKRILLDEIGIIGYRLPDWTVYDMAKLVHAEPIAKVIARGAPSLWILRGNWPSHEIQLPGEKPMRYKQVSYFKVRDFDCSLLKREEEN